LWVRIDPSTEGTPPSPPPIADTIKVFVGPYYTTLTKGMQMSEVISMIQDYN